MISKLKELQSVVPPNLLAERDGKPLLSPNKSEEISAIASYANQHSLAIEIAGAGTKRTWGNPIQPNPGAAGLLQLDTTRLTGVVSHSWHDLTATVAAGTPWATMQQALAQHNQQVALDPLWPETATVGGIIATNDSGSLRLKYGSLRDLILGMTIVLADGTIAKSGGKVVKNVAGYDLHKLMTGAFGTLGIITEVTFRLHPIPAHPRNFTVSAPQATQLAPLIAAIRDSYLQTEGLQLRGDTNGFHLGIQLNAHPDAHQSAVLESLVAACGMRLDRRLDIHQNVSPSEIASATECAFASEIGLGFSPGIQAAGNPGFSPRDTAFAPQSAREALFRNGATVIKVSVLPTELCEYLDQMQWAPDIEVACVAQSSGLIYASLVGSREAIEAYLQSIKADFTILATSTKLNRWKAAPNSLPLMREIKHRFDPNRILNPGRFIGGI